METQLVLLLVFIIVFILLLKAFKAIITIAGCIFLLVTLAFFLRSQNIVNFDIPEDFNLKNINFRINDNGFFKDNNVKEKNIKSEEEFKESKSKNSIEKIKEQEMAEEQNIKNKQKDI